MKERAPDAVLAAALREHKPDIVGLSLRNLDNQDYVDSKDFVPDYVSWVGMANEVAPTIIGGSAVMTMPEELFERVGATYGMIGQGDEAFPRFLNEFQAGATSFQTPGVMWRESGRIRRNPGLLPGYANGGTMDWNAIDVNRYRKSQTSACVITKTGCPHDCLFCDAKAVVRFVLGS